MCLIFVIWDKVHMAPHMLRSLPSPPLPLPLPLPLPSLFATHLEADAVWILPRTIEQLLVILRKESPEKIAPKVSEKGFINQRPQSFGRGEGKRGGERGEGFTAGKGVVVDAVGGS